MRTLDTTFWKLDNREASALVLPSSLEGLRLEDQDPDQERGVVFRTHVGARFAKAMPSINVSVNFMYEMVGARVGLLTAVKKGSASITLFPEPPQKKKGARLPWHILWFPTHVHGTDRDPVEPDRVLASARQLRQLMDDDRYAWLPLQEKPVVFPRAREASKFIELLDDYFSGDDRVAWAAP